MKTITFESPKATDRQVVESIERLFRAFGTNPTKLMFQLFIDTQIECAFDQLGTNPQVQEILAYDSELVQAFQI